MHGAKRQGRRLGAALGVMVCLLVGVPALGSGATPAAGPAFDNLPREVLHEVERGQDLHLIAGYYYGDARQWERIWQANRGVIRNPNRLRPGMALRVPVDRDWKQDLSYADWIKIGGPGRSRIGGAGPPSAEPRTSAEPAALPPPPPAATPPAPAKGPGGPATTKGSGGRPAAAKGPGGR